MSTRGCRAQIQAEAYTQHWWLNDRCRLTSTVQQAVWCCSLRCCSSTTSLPLIRFNCSLLNPSFAQATSKGAARLDVPGISADSWEWLRDEKWKITFQPVKVQVHLQMRYAVFLHDHVPNVVILSRCNTLSVESQSQGKRLRCLLGHVFQMPNDRLP